MSFLKKHGEKAVNGVMELTDRTRQAFEKYLYSLQGVLKPSEKSEELSQVFNTAYLVGSKTTYPALTFAFGCWDIKQLTVLAQAMALSIRDEYLSSQYEIYPIFKTRLEVNVRDRIIVSTRIAFVPSDELDTCLTSQTVGHNANQILPEPK